MAATYVCMVLYRTKDGADAGDLASLLPHEQPLCLIASVDYVDSQKAFSHSIQYISIRSSF
jgi:hypothetical protein